MIFSYSRLSLYETCPFRFKKKYVDGYEEIETLPLALGKGVHKAAEERLQGAMLEDSLISGFIEANFHPDLQKDAMARLVAKVPVKRLEKRVLEIEKHFQLPLAPTLNAPIIQGYIDLLTKDGCLYDWKTNRVPYDVTSTHQMGLYAWAVSKIFGYDTVIATLSFLRFRKEDKFKYTRREMEISRKWAYDLAIEIDMKVKEVMMFPKLEMDIFESNPSSRCGTCPFAIECYYKDEKRLEK
ncbi:PD-(D/E)XK nuclease family protein [Viridibacillus sp. NPDC093762]|uniref:PD-(D/E)XK nuclease family protein n=1 Tax=Viridibacillus sp. NPDC093762 TaxID=3390720 RepID=UPI003D06F76D